MAIRRTVGGFALAAAVAAALVLLPAAVHAQSGTTTTTSSTCDTIRQTIQYITATYDEPLESVLLAPWKTAATLYHCE